MRYTPPHLQALADMCYNIFQVGLHAASHCPCYMANSYQSCTKVNCEQMQHCE